MKVARLAAHLALSISMILAPLTLSASNHKFADKLGERAYEATGILYVAKNATDMPRRACTIWNVAKIGDGYEAISASHCATLADSFPDGDLYFWVSYSDPVFGEDGKPVTPKDLVPAHVIAFGNDNQDTDISLWDVQTTQKLPVLPLGESNKLKIGEKVINASIPFEGLDKSVYSGFVSQVEIRSNVPILDHKIHAEIPGTGPGSSGSAVLSEKQKAVIGILVLGNQEQNVVLLVPVDLIKQFMQSHPESSTPRIEPKPHVDPPAQESAFDFFRPMGVDQHGHAHGNGDRNGGHRGDRGDRSRPDPRGFNRSNHGHIGGQRGFGRHRQVYFGGYWFGCALWPEWVFAEDVYFVAGPNGVWEVISYGNPNLVVQVYVVE